MLRLSLAALFGALLLPSCLDAKDDTKGVVDDSAPPTIPGEAGKADDPAHAIAIVMESPHPYANNVDRKTHLDLMGRLPACAHQARLHFSILRTEASYDFVDVMVGSTIIDSFDGTHDNTWSSWVDVTAAGLDVRLTTDGSVTRHGFVVDQVEWAGSGDRCPVYPLLPCPEGSFHVTAPVAECSCPPPPACIGPAGVSIDHVTARGFLHVGKRTEGVAASTLGTGPTDGIVATPIGEVAFARLSALISQAAAAGLLLADGYDHGAGTDGTRDLFTITAGPHTASFVAPPGGHDAAVAQLITAFEALFVCDGADAALTCGDGFVCGEETCQPDACVCAEVYEPVCGVNGLLYGNACEAGCADVDVAHAGECGEIGDVCGGILGRPCLEDNKCRYAASAFEAPYPDASGACVARTYCDAPVDCNGLPAPAVLGSWACEANTCAFRAGPNWRDVTDGRFTTAHPYASSTSVWKQLYLPAEAQAMRLIVDGTFRLERNYDFLEVWTWTNGAWTRARRYTGTAGPAATDTFTGRYFYLRFVSDSSVNDQGFDVTTQWR